MSINYDPDGKARIDGDVMLVAKQLGCHVINIVCDPEGAKPGDVGGVSFACITPFVPREGEHIELDDGTVCKVKTVTYRTAQLDTHPYLVVNVIATIVGKRL